MGRGLETGRGGISAVTAVSTALAVGLALVPATVEGQCPLSSYPAAWATASWTPYTSLNTPIQDEVKGPDGSYGTTPEPDNVDIFNGTGANLPSLYWAFSGGDPTVAGDEILFFRQRLEGDPRQGGTTSNYKQYTWTSNFDLDGDGFSDILVQVNGYTDTVQILHDTAGNNLFDKATCASGGDLVYQVGTATTTQVTDQTASGGGYLLDWQLPLCAFDDCSGAQVLTTTSPFSLTFTTSTNEGNPTLKDGGFPGDYQTASDRRLPDGDTCSLDGGCTQRPWIGGRSATCSGSPTSSVALNAKTLDTLVVNNSPPCSDAKGCLVDSIASVLFEYKPIAGSGWTPIATLTSPDSGSVNSWSTSWDVSGLSGTQYWVRATVTDDQGNTNSFDPDNNGDVRGQFLVDLSKLNQDCIIGSLPVSLAWVQTRREAEATRVRWATVTESGNVGFVVWGLGDGVWRILGHGIVPSAAVDSVEPLEYEIVVEGPVEAVLIEDLDIRGGSRIHGPFLAGASYGGKPEPSPVDWPRVQRALAGAARAKATASTGVDALRLLVGEDGIYRVSYEELVAAGLDLRGAAAGDIALTSFGEPVPITIRRPTSSSSHSRGFGPGWAVEFVGQALDDLYTSTGTYLLTADRSLARRTGYARAVVRPREDTLAHHAVHALRVERDRQYSFSAPNGDPWYDERLLTYTSPERWSFELVVDHLEPDGGPATLEVDLWGWTNFEQDPDHHVRVFFNGELLADELFDGLHPLTISVELPEGVLVEGINTLELELPGDTGAAYDLVALDGYRLHYPRQLVARDGRLAFDSDGVAMEVRGLPEGGTVAYRLDPTGPVRVWARREGDVVRVAGTGSPAGYVVSSEDALLVPRLEAPRPHTDITSGTADYLIISHPLFLGGIGELVAAREADGLEVLAVDVEDVYEQFNHGVFGARAVAAYIRHAALHMGTRFVLLVGGDTYDYHDNLGLGSVSFIPSPYMATHEVVRFAPVDPAYGDCDGDLVPEVAVGRLPVRTPEELAAVISKILWFETKSYDRTAVFAADLEDGPASFSAMSDELIALMGPGWTVDRAYMDELERDGARQALSDAINRGVALTSFIGHSALTMWSFERLFESDDAVALTNHGWPTVVLQWGCWNTYHASPKVTTLGEAFMATGDQGAAAVLGAVTLTEVSSDQALSSRLLPLLAVPGTTLGEAMIGAKSELAADNPGALDVLLGWSLLGDPAMALERP